MSDNDDDNSGMNGNMSLFDGFCTADGKTISAEKVLFSLYENRAKPEQCQGIVDFLCKCLDEKRYVASLLFVEIVICKLYLLPF
jgi:hypothetical protein